MPCQILITRVYVRENERRLTNDMVGFVMQGVPRIRARGNKNVRQAFEVSIHAYDLSTLDRIPGEGTRRTKKSLLYCTMGLEDLRKRPTGARGEADCWDGEYMYPKAQLFELEDPSWRMSPGGQAKT